MYCEYYQFSEKPFTVTPNPRFIFLSKFHQEAFAHLLYGIDNHAGFIELTGEIGTGKTTVLRTLLGNLDEKLYRSALILNPCLSANELLRNINHEYGIGADGLSNGDLLRELNSFLLQEKAAGRTVVLVIDEAQNLEPSVLEQIRLISNLETDTDKLIQIVLAGQPELSTLLKRRELRQLSQRITVRYHLRPMDLEDTRAYVRHRLRVAGCGLTVAFTPSALRCVYRFSGGTPRLINIVCDRALLVGYGESRRVIDPGTVKSAIREVCRPKKTNKGMAIAASAAAVIVLAALVSYPALKSSFFSDHTAGKLSFAGHASAGVADQLQKALAGVGERESLIEAFNVIAAAWGERPVKDGAAWKKPDLARLSELRGMRLFVVTRDIGAIIHSDSPVIVEIDLPGAQGKRYLALTSFSNGRFQCTPQFRGKVSLSPDELKILWSGRAYVLWKNFRRIPLVPSSVAKGPEIIRLQKMLAQTGYEKVSNSGKYDAETAAAVKAFQRSRGLVADGVVGGKTLLFLYREEGDFHSPRLSQGRGDARG